MVESGVPGWVVPSEDQADMVAALMEAVSDPERTRGFAHAGKARYERLFSFEAMLQGYRALYDRVAKRERSKELED